MLEGERTRAMTQAHKAQDMCLVEKNNWIRSSVRTVAWLLAEFGKAEAVEGGWVWIDLWVEVNSNRGECGVGSFGDSESVGEDYVCHCEACERY
jgi:hypothetical protein